MLFSWLRRRRRHKVLSKPLPSNWSECFESLPFYATLTEQEQSRLVADARILVAEKNWEGCGGLVLTEQMQVVIAAQAALLILNLEHEFYRRTESILVYPSTFVLPERHQRAGTVQASGTAVLGLAQLGGPVVLAWDSAQHGAENAKDGRNVVYHEFAHKLDMLDRMANGTPPLHQRDQYQAWQRIMTREFEKLNVDTKKRRRTLLDKYGASEPAEFFAVATECFFEKPRLLRDKHPELYEQFQTYYRQDPATR